MNHKRRVFGRIIIPHDELKHEHELMVGTVTTFLHLGYLQDVATMINALFGYLVPSNVILKSLYLSGGTNTGARWEENEERTYITAPGFTKHDALLSSCGMRRRTFLGKASSVSYPEGLGNFLRFSSRTKHSAIERSLPTGRRRTRTHYRLGLG